MKTKTEQGGMEDRYVQKSMAGAAATEICENADSIPNATLTTPKLLTLAIVNKDGRVLLGLKKRGFGEGYYNGFGGKVEEGETIEEATARELEEESGLIPLRMTKQGVLTFHFDDKPCPWEVAVLLCGQLQFYLLLLQVENVTC
eukprot:Gb_40140 [translate_table: standard]